MSFAKMIAVPCLLFGLFFSHEHIGSGHNVYLVIILYFLSLTLGNGICNCLHIGFLAS